MRRFSWFQFWLKAYQRIRLAPVIPLARHKNVRRQWRRSYREKRTKYEARLQESHRLRCAFEQGQRKEQLRRTQELIGRLMRINVSRDHSNGLQLQCVTMIDAAPLLGAIPPGDNRFMEEIARMMAWKLERELRSMNLWSLPDREQLERPNIYPGMWDTPP